MRLFRGIKKIPNNSIDSIITDPPAWINFMGKWWDKDKWWRDIWIEWMQKIAIECLRVLKPWWHALVWSIPRTSHWTAFAFENAWFDIKDKIYHIFWSWFPKSQNIWKNIDKIQWNKREEYIREDFLKRSNKKEQSNSQVPCWKKGIYTKSNSKYEWWWTALKPAHEDWILLKKPITEKNIALNVLKWWTGGINIDKSRIGTDGARNNWNTKGTAESNSVWYYWKAIKQNYDMWRFPANLIHDWSEIIINKFPKTKSGGGDGCRVAKNKIIHF